MEEEIKQLYTKLSSGKEITSSDYVISEKHFNSISCHLFIAELKKRGITWGGEDTSIDNLVTNTTKPVISGEVVPVTVPVTSSQQIANGFSIGIDIQKIDELPACHDYWEDGFYQMRFQPEEIAYCVKKDNPVQSFAGIYSCKEAIIKCNNSMKWEQILIKYKNDKPVFDGYEISISHSGNFAISVAAKGAPSPINHSLTPFETTEEIKKDDVVYEKKKNYNVLLFSLILLMVGYIVLRDFFIK